MTDEPIEHLRSIDRPHSASDEFRASLSERLRSEFSASEAMGELASGSSLGSDPAGDLVEDDDFAVVDPEVQLVVVTALDDVRPWWRPGSRVTLAAAVVFLVALIGVGLMVVGSDDAGVDTAHDPSEDLVAAELVEAFCRTYGNGFAGRTMEYLARDVEISNRGDAFLVDIEAQSQELADVVSLLPDSVRRAVLPSATELLIAVSQIREARAIDQTGRLGEAKTAEGAAVTQYVHTLTLLPGSSECAPGRLRAAVDKG